MLSEIKAYLMQREIPVSLSELSNHFDMEPDTMQYMLVHWVRKGKVIEHENHCSVSSDCKGCSSSKETCYQWSMTMSNKKINGILFNDNLA